MVSAWILPADPGLIDMGRTEQHTKTFSSDMGGNQTGTVHNLPADRSYLLNCLQQVTVTRPDDNACEDKKEWPGCQSFI